jgi:hypothetical protein
MDHEPKQQPFAMAFQELENLRKPELDPGSPISRINSIISEIENLQESDVYDPVALAKRCLDLYASAANEATKNIAYAHVNAAVRIKTMYQHGVITPEHMERIKKNLEAMKLPDSLPTQQSWHVSPRQSQRATQTILATGAFICSFFIERLIRKLINLPEFDWWLASLSGGLLIFAIMFMFFDRFGEGIKERINWKVFYLTRNRTLNQLIQLRRMCQAYFESVDELIPHLAYSGNDENAPGSR